jgi:hypothetical protein
MDTLPCAFCEAPHSRAHLRRDHELDICDRCALGGAQAMMAWRGHTINKREWTTEIRSQGGSKHTIYHLSITGHAPGFSVTADFSREGMLNKLRKLFQREIEVGDPLFDDFVYINTREREETEALLRRSGAQSTLMDLRFDRVTFINGTFELYKRDTNPTGLGVEGALALCALLVHIEHRHDPGPSMNATR